MGCSARRLSSTRSATVRSVFLALRVLAAGFLNSDIAGLSLAAPIPPLALLGGKKRVACLGHGGGKDILATDIDGLAGGATEFLVEPGRILPSKLLNAANAETLKIAEHGWSNGN